ncbi:MAG: LCP family protein [Candidatus Kerfeldbacteria bacterium]|nr:LCP family protein [Candidatus Kerfeldbacteria bacterium]
MPDLLQPQSPSSTPKRPRFDPTIYQPSGTPGNDKKSRPAKSRSHLLLWSSLALALVIILIGLGFITKIVLAVNSTNSTTGEKIGFIDQIKHLIDNPEPQLKGESADRINILLAGIGGEGHQGSYLADTIILISYKPSTNEMATVSIPRDLYVEIPDYGFRKINNALAFGVQSDYPGGGEALLARVVSETFELPIHYTARIDFEGFRKAIDELGGIEIDVAQSFTDYEYPDYNYGYQTITFTKGIEEMDGERALQYVRSRHGNNGEGSDFARSQRQQKVLLALKNKFFSVNSLVNPASIVSALDSLGQHNQTNMEIWEIAQLAKMLEPIQKENIVSVTLDTSPEGYLVSDHTLDGAYILRPVSGDFTEINARIANVFDTSAIVKEDARIEVQNGTTQEGLATDTAELLTTQLYNVVKVANAETDTAVTQTTIYDYTGGTKPYTLAALKTLLNARLAPAIPALINSNQKAIPATVAEDIDILIIIGNDRLDPALLSTASN